MLSQCSYTNLSPKLARDVQKKLRKVGAPKENPEEEGGNGEKKESSRIWVGRGRVKKKREQDKTQNNKIRRSGLQGNKGVNQIP